MNYFNTNDLHERLEIIRELSKYKSDKIIKFFYKVNTGGALYQKLFYGFIFRWHLLLLELLSSHICKNKLEGYSFHFDCTPPITYISTTADSFFSRSDSGPQRSA